jgi:undecaprenyl-phosphate 4-deoxy-4-formamido-L-arabinose transferase
MDKKMMVSLVIPIYNEEANLSHLIERLRSVMQRMGKNYEIIFVDDGSRDNTLSILKSFLIYPEIRVVELTRNYGQHAAIFSGFSVVQGDIVITLDADLQNPPEEIPNLVRVMEEGDDVWWGQSEKDERIPSSGLFHLASSMGSHGRSRR